MIPEENHLPEKVLEVGTPHFPIAPPHNSKDEVGGQRPPLHIQQKTTAVGPTAPKLHFMPKLKMNHFCSLANILKVKVFSSDFVKMF